MIKHFIDLSDQELCKFLTYCMFPNEERIIQQCKLYKTSEDRSLHGIYLKDILVGIIGLILTLMKLKLNTLLSKPNIDIEELDKN